MAKQRPNLGVSAAPVNTYVASVAPAVELYDQQSVNLALQFADAFKDLSLSAAQLTATLKKEQNEEERLKGIDVVNSNQKSFKELVDSGEIKPAENPWMAVGAQQASGVLEGMKARVHFSQMYEKRSQEDPAFFDSPASFDTLAAQYVQNVDALMGNATYMKRAFYESFNPFIASMAMKHEEKVTEARNQKVLVGVGAEFAKATQDIASPDPIIKNNAITALQEGIDNWVKSGYSAKQINEAVIDNAVAMMATSDDVESAEEILNTLKAGTGRLADTEYAKAALLANSAKIENNRNRMTTAESRKFYEWSQGILAQVVGGKLSEEDALKQFDAYVEGPDRKISISGPEAESKRAWLLNSFKQGKAEAERLRVKEQENTVLKVINNSFQIPTEYLNNEAKYRSHLEDKMETMFSEFKFDEATKLQYRGIFERVWGSNAEKREQYRIQTLSESIWKDSVNAAGQNEPGLDVTAATQFVNYLLPAEGTMPDVPQFLAMKERIDDTRSQMGIAPNTEKAQTLYRQDYARLDQILRNQENAVAAKFSGQTLASLPTDSEQTREAKQDVRAKFRFLRMKMGTVFNDDREVRTATQAYNNIVSPYNAETGEGADIFKDTLAAYRMAVQNGIALDQVVLSPQSPNGKRMLAELKWALGQMSANVPATNIQRDIASGRVFGTQLDTDFFDRNNPMGWLQFNSGSGVDADKFNEGRDLWRNANGVTEPDAVFYLSSEYWNHYSQAIRGDALGKGDKAIKMANAAMLENNILVRGSMIPKRNMAASVDTDYLEAYLRVNYPNHPNATFVVVQTTTEGALLAVRQDGSAVDNKIIRSTDLNPSSKNPEIVEMIRKINTEKARRTKQMDIGRPQVGEPKF